VTRRRPPSHPPPAGPTPLTERQRAAITDVIGADADASLILALRDARGRTFQRLEFLGDPLLELVEGLVDVVVAGAVPQHRSTTDDALARQAAALGVQDWLEWTPSAQRLADLVEAVAGAAFLTGGWRAIGSVYQRLRGPLPSDVLALLAAAEPRVAPDPEVEAATDRAHASLGASVLEVAATLEVYRGFPAADEGELSAQRRERHVTVRIAAWARTVTGTLIVAPNADDKVLGDAVEAWLGRIATVDGPAAAVVAGSTVLDQAPALEVLRPHRSRTER
jgi:dsRNA-specific ribonuclease